MSQSLEPIPPAQPWMDERQMALIIYILFLAPLGGITHLVGLSWPTWLATAPRRGCGVTTPI